jgi:hypothetical protein
MITRRRQFAALLLASLLLGSVGASAASAHGKGNSGRDLLRAAIAIEGPDSDSAAVVEAIRQRTTSPGVSR